MNFKLGNKKITIFIIILALLLVAGGVFWWWENREIKGSPDDYVIKETVEGKIVENKKAGSTVKVPNGWGVERVEQLEGSIVLYTQDLEGKERSGIPEPLLTRGCGIETAVVYKNMDFDELKEYIKELHIGLGIKSEEFEIITLRNYQALKDTFDSRILGPSIAVCIPYKNRLYSFAVYWGPEEKDKCIQEFNKFLETVEIK